MHLRSYTKRFKIAKIRAKAHYKHSQKGVLRSKLQFLRHWHLADQRRFIYGNYARLRALADYLTGSGSHCLLQFSAPSTTAMAELCQLLKQKGFAVQFLTSAFLRQLSNSGFSTVALDKLAAGGHLMLVRSSSIQSPAQFLANLTVLTKDKGVVLVPLVLKIQNLALSPTYLHKYATERNLQTQFLVSLQVASQKPWISFLGQWRDYYGSLLGDYKKILESSSL